MLSNDVSTNIDDNFGARKKRQKIVQLVGSSESDFFKADPCVVLILFETDGRFNVGSRDPFKF